jgi:hypothetical protein
MGLSRDTAAKWRAAWVASLGRHSSSGEMPICWIWRFGANLAQDVEKLYMTGLPLLKVAARMHASLCF